MREDEQVNPNKVGEELKTSTIVVLGIGFFMMLMMIYFSVMMHGKGESSWYVFIIIGVVLLALCVLLVSRNIKRFIIGKRREHLLKSGKLKEVASKSYNPKHKFDD